MGRFYRVKSLQRLIFTAEHAESAEEFLKSEIGLFDVLGVFVALCEKNLLKQSISRTHSLRLLLRHPGYPVGRLSLQVGNGNHDDGIILYAVVNTIRESVDQATPDFFLVI
jgi:hypothetical protein